MASISTAGIGAAITGALASGARRNMGLGALGLAQTQFKRKFRWTLSITPKCSSYNSGLIGPNFVKMAARPNYDIEETELNFLNAKTWIAGKLTWQSITTTFIDANAQEIKGLYEWIGMNAQLNNSSTFFQGTSFQDYAATAELIMYSGCGQPMEIWQLDNVWPQAVNFGELDYTSSEEATIELTLRYDKVSYTGFCPTPVFNPCCTPCGSPVVSQ
jgi:hypothetical protein